GRSRRAGEGGQGGPRQAHRLRRPARWETGDPRREDLRRPHPVSGQDRRDDGGRHLPLLRRRNAAGGGVDPDGALSPGGWVEGRFATLSDTYSIIITASSFRSSPVARPEALRRACGPLAMTPTPFAKPQGVPPGSFLLECGARELSGRELRVDDD